MTTTCACCGEPLPEASGMGRPARFLSDAHRKAYERGARPRVSAQIAEEHPAAAPLGEPVRKVPQRAFYAADSGDGDRCPQDPAHGRMYFMKPAMECQWCPSSRHAGNPFYLRDGKTSIEATRPALGAAHYPGPALAADLSAAPQGLIGVEELPPGSSATSELAAFPATPGRPSPGVGGGHQLAMPLGASPS